MWKIIKVKVEPLTPEAFEPFGEVIKSFDAARPEVRTGGLRENAYTVSAALSDAPSEAGSKRVPLSAGIQRAHFAYHTDAGQAFYPTRHCPTVYFVAPAKECLAPEDVRAFYSDGSLGICMRLRIWHTMPICVEGTEVYKTVRGDGDYHAHSVDVHFDEEQGLALEPDLAKLLSRSG
jgi:ureidoglycolate lyase